MRLRIASLRTARTVVHRSTRTDALTYCRTDVAAFIADRYGARDEHSLPISGGYVYDYNPAAGRAVGPGGAPAAAAAAPEPPDEADQALKAAAVSGGGSCEGL